MPCSVAGIDNPYLTLIIDRPHLFAVHGLLPFKSDLGAFLYKYFTDRVGAELLKCSKVLLFFRVILGFPCISNNYND